MTIPQPSAAKIHIWAEENYQHFKKREGASSWGALDLVSECAWDLRFIYKFQLVYSYILHDSVPSSLCGQSQFIAAGSGRFSQTVGTDRWNHLVNGDALMKALALKYINADETLLSCK